MSELSRYKKALDTVVSHLRALGLDEAHFTEQLMTKVDAIINPPPEMEEVEETIGWLNIYPERNGRRANFHGSKMTADDRAGDDRTDCQEIKVKVQRPKPQKAERSAGLTFCRNGANGYISDVDLSGKSGTFIYQD